MRLIIWDFTFYSTFKRFINKIFILRPWPWVSHVQSSTTPSSKCQTGCLTGFIADMRYIWFNSVDRVILRAVEYRSYKDQSDRSICTRNQTKSSFK